MLGLNMINLDLSFFLTWNCLLFIKEILILEYLSEDTNKKDFWAIWLAQLVNRATRVQFPDNAGHFLCDWSCNPF
jgi:hypothetical protein